MSELISAGDIACCVDVFHIRAQLLVDGYATFGVVDAGFLEIEARDCWLPARGDQQELAAGFLAVSRHDNLVAFLARGFGPAPHKSDAFALEDTLNYLANFRFLFRE